MGEVIPLPLVQLNNSACPRCRSEWWAPRAVTIAVDGRPTGYAHPVVCIDCGWEKA